MMTRNGQKARALGLCSGGLDSILAALVLRRQGIEVHWISFETPFYTARNARKAAGMAGISLTVKNITRPYVDMLRNPRCGYGRQMNPCMDCHALMFRLAGEIMKESGFDFLFSGEVLAQRPMSQTRSSLRYVEKHSGFDGYILRPLSAKKLPETVPENQGLVDRTLLLDISGRSRKPQMALAEQFGVRDYPAPAGGCLLTDKGFCLRLKDLFDHQQYFEENELHLLKYGRHFRLSKQGKAVVGRTRRDNQNMLRYYDPRCAMLLKTKGYPGPTALISRNAQPNDIRLTAAICVGYSKAPAGKSVQVSVTSAGVKQVLDVVGIPPADARHMMI